MAKETQKSGQPGGRDKQRERKQQVLTKKTPSIVQSIADAVVVKEGNLFFLCKPDGSVPVKDGHGFGLYYHDCRFLSGYELSIAGEAPHSLMAASRTGFRATLQLTNPQLKLKGENSVDPQDIGIEWQRMIDSEAYTFYDQIILRNYSMHAFAAPVEMAFAARFEDIFDIRGLLREHPGTLHPPEWTDGELLFRYDGADGLHRKLAVRFDPCPDHVEDGHAHFSLTLEPQRTVTVRVFMTVSETAQAGARPRHVSTEKSLKRVTRDLKRHEERFMASTTSVKSDSLLLNRVIDQGLRDLGTLRSRMGGYGYFAAGVPWFATLFGRDSEVTALQTLAFDPEIAAETLRLLASYQGTHEDFYRDEQPGKILHEMRVGELANIEAIPHTPYYGSIDATPLFLILMAEHARWTGSLDLFDELKENVERALTWMTCYGDHDGDAFIEYDSATENGLANQGWKDSGDAIVNADGSLATPPISLVEVQGYAYKARMGIAELYERKGDHDRAKALREAARRLRERFAEAFWSDELDCLVLALQKGGRPASVVTSNAGQALWGGIVEPAQAKKVSDRLMAADIFCGWGVRTLSEDALRYNPVGYHLGTVWPHDNSLIAAGMKRYGFDDAAERIFKGIFQAATHFDEYRMPEVFSGYREEEFGEPVRYPVACHPQAWAAGSVPFLLTTMLGLAPEAFEKRLRIVRPRLPEFLTYVELYGLRVGQARIDLRFERSARGVEVKTLRKHGEIDVVVSEEERHEH